MQINGAGPIYHNYDQPNEIDQYQNVTNKIPGLKTGDKIVLNFALTNIHDFIKHILHCFDGSKDIGSPFTDFNNGLDVLNYMINKYHSPSPLVETLKAARDFAEGFTHNPIDMFTVNNGHFEENYPAFWNNKPDITKFDTELKSHLERMMENKYQSVFKKGGYLWSTEDGQGNHDSIDTALNKVFSMSTIPIPDA